MVSPSIRAFYVHLMRHFSSSLVRLARIPLPAHTVAPGGGTTGRRGCRSLSFSLDHITLWPSKKTERERTSSFIHAEPGNSFISFCVSDSLTCLRWLPVAPPTPRRAHVSTPPSSSAIPSNKAGRLTGSWFESISRSLRLPLGESPASPNIELSRLPTS